MRENVFYPWYKKGIKSGYNSEHTSGAKIDFFAFSPGIWWEFTVIFLYDIFRLLNFPYIHFSTGKISTVINNILENSIREKVHIIINFFLL